MLKREFCNFLIESNIIKELDVINHSYTLHRKKTLQNGGKVVEEHNLMCTLTTRPDCLGVTICNKKGDNMNNSDDINVIGNYSPSNHNASRIVDTNGVSPTVMENHGTVTAVKNNLRIRKLTPRECFRLMGVKDEDSDKLDNLSNNVKYHLAGDSIVVNVLEAIFKSILMDYPVVEQKPIRLIELFAGYGSQSLALKYLNMPYESYKICEWAIPSINAYKYIHYPTTNIDWNSSITKEELVNELYDLGVSNDWNKPMKYESLKRKGFDYLKEAYDNILTTHNLVDITKVHAKDLDIRERERWNYILTYSFPCQDLSLAGKMGGMKKGSGTRSGMLWEVERILKESGDNLPQILLMENVPQVVNKKNMLDFTDWCNFLESIGYTNKYEIINAKEVGYPEPVPQNRKRCFMVSVLNPKCDIVFPDKTERHLTLKDMLEDNVDEKYYLSDRILNNYFLKEDINGNYPRKERFLQNINRKNQDVGNAVTTRAGDRPTDNFVVKHIQNTINEKGYLPEMYNPYHESEISDSSPTLTTTCGSTTSSSSVLISHNKRLKETLAKNEIKETPTYIDEYNKTVQTDTSGAITTRVSSSNNTFLAVKNATKKGYLEAREGDGVDISSRMKYHRGTVQEQSIQTLTTSCGTDVGVVEKEKWSDLD